MKARIATVLLASLALGASFRASDAAAQRSGAATPAVDPDAGIVAKGRYLAAIGNCETCHTAEGGRSLAGGRAMQTPFGVIHSTNVTPDRVTGIGRWTVESFRRAMQEGTGPDDRNYYPAFPYDHFARVDPADIDAIYVWLLRREPVRASTPENRLRFPYGARPLVAAWKNLYLRPGAPVSDPAQTAQWNRGRYLVDGLGHCGACHTPRNAMGAEIAERDLDGGFVDGWYAPALNGASRAPVRWTVDALVAYLRAGYDEHHGAPNGPMAPVAQALAGVPDDEVRAMAVYLAARMSSSDAPDTLAVTRDARRAEAGSGAGHDAAHDAAHDASAAVYEGACAGCHGGRRAVRLEYSTAVADVTPANIVRVIVDGISIPEGEPGRAMPGYRGALTEAQTVALVRFLRANFSRARAWTDVGDEVASVVRAGAAERQP